jgi:hypothetical protein
MSVLLISHLSRHTLDRHSGTVIIRQHRASLEVHYPPQLGHFVASIKCRHMPCATSQSFDNKRGRQSAGIVEKTICENRYLGEGVLPSRVPARRRLIEAARRAVERKAVE